jgi:hypothetical protein
LLNSNVAVAPLPVPIAWSLALTAASGAADELSSRSRQRKP